VEDGRARGVAEVGPENPQEVGTDPVEGTKGLAVGGDGREWSFCSLASWLKKRISSCECSRATGRAETLEIFILGELGSIVGGGTKENAVTGRKFGIRLA
jgi:hypothetical protein